MDGDLFLPLTSANFGNELIMDSFEKFKDSNTELKWAKLLYDQKAGIFYPDMKKGDRDVISEMIKTPRGFLSGESDLIDIFTE